MGRNKNNRNRGRKRSVASTLGHIKTLDRLLSGEGLEAERRQREEEIRAEEAVLKPLSIDATVIDALGAEPLPPEELRAARKQLSLVFYLMFLHAHPELLEDPEPELVSGLQKDSLPVPPEEVIEVEVILDNEEPGFEEIHKEEPEAEVISLHVQEEDPEDEPRFIDLREPEEDLEEDFGELEEETNLYESENVLETEISEPPCNQITPIEEFAAYLEVEEADTNPHRGLTQLLTRQLGQQLNALNPIFTALAEKDLGRGLDLWDEWRVTCRRLLQQLDEQLMQATTTAVAEEEPSTRSAESMIREAFDQLMLNVGTVPNFRLILARLRGARKTHADLSWDIKYLTDGLKRIHVSIDTLGGVVQASPERASEEDIERYRGHVTEAQESLRRLAEVHKRQTEHIEAINRFNTAYLQLCEEVEGRVSAIRTFEHTITEILGADLPDDIESALVEARESLVPPIPPSDRQFENIKVVPMLTPELQFLADSLPAHAGWLASLEEVESEDVESIFSIALTPDQHLTQIVMVAIYISEHLLDPPQLYGRAGWAELMEMADLITPAQATGGKDGEVATLVMQLKRKKWLYNEQVGRNIWLYGLTATGHKLAKRFASNCTDIQDLTRRIETARNERALINQERYQK